MAPTGAGALGPPYRLYFNEDETRSRGNEDGKNCTNVSSKESFLDLVEKRSKIVARARSHGQPQKYVSLVNEQDTGTDEEETVFYENNNISIHANGNSNINPQGESCLIPEQRM